MSNYSRRKEAEALKRKQENKKTIITAIIFIVVVAAIVFGFVYADKLRNAENTASGDPNYDVFDYVTLGQYEGLEVYYIIPEVTDEDVQKQIDSIIASKTEYKEFTDRVIQAGDKVTIDYTGVCDGEKFEGGTSTDYTYILGQGSMIEGFDEGIYGMEVGQTKVIDVTFPTDYHVEDLKGKNAQFTIKVDKAQGVSFKPEWNDEFVAEYSKDKYKTTADYEKYLKDSLMTSATSSSESQFSNDMWNAIYENAKIEGYPEYLYNSLYMTLSSNLKQSASYYGLSVDQYLEYFGGGMDLEEYVMQYVESTLISKAIIKDMKLKLPKDKYKEYATADMLSSGYATISELENAYGKDNLEEYYLELYLADVLREKCVIKEVTADEYEIKMKEQAVEEK